MHLVQAMRLCDAPSTVLPIDHVLGQTIPQEVGHLLRRKAAPANGNRGANDVAGHLV